MHDTGTILIGRNEGERLRRSLASVAGTQSRVVYVDSGSSDGSVELARAMGADVVELSSDLPFTAARARNTGFTRLMALSSGIEFVQFLDGDCELAAEWVSKAVNALRSEPQLAIVFGRRRERFPDASIYNRLCDMEWDTPIGEATECGGDAMFRAAAFASSGGYNVDLIAGEEPELCVRLRAEGWKLERLDAEMTLHDAAITRFSQWWKRHIRNGHAFAEGAAMHGNSPAKHWVKQARSNWVWGLCAPLIILASAFVTHGLGLLMLVVYPLLFVKVRHSAVRRGRSARDATLYSAFCVVGKFAQAQGQLRYVVGSLLGRRRTLIEYKADVPESSQPATSGA
jgi:glycosyltransferase involved in cell wall biosynthesis